MIFVSILLAISDAKPVATYLYIFEYVLVFLYVFNLVVHSETIWLKHFAVNDPTTKKQGANETTDSAKLWGEGVDYFATDTLKLHQGNSFCWAPNASDILMPYEPKPTQKTTESFS